MVETYTYTGNTYTGTGALWNAFNDPFFIGFDKFTDRLANAHSNTSGFPPYNVRKIDEDTFVVELAVAGYNKSSLDVTEHEGTLTIKGERPEDQEEYVHKGIAGRKFTRTFALGEYVHVDSADLNDGMLYIVVKREVPEEKKPKNIKIK
jgi:molecular chaperone IbpA